MLADFGTATECEVDKVDPVGVNDGECFSAGLRICTRNRRAMAKLEDEAKLSKRRLLKIRPVPFLQLATCQNNIKSSYNVDGLTLMTWSGLKVWTWPMHPPQRN